MAVGTNARGETVIKLTTKEAVREPLLDFLLVANWSRARCCVSTPCCWIRRLPRQEVDRDGFTVVREAGPRGEASHRNQAGAAVAGSETGTCGTQAAGSCRDAKGSAQGGSQAGGTTATAGAETGCPSGRRQRLRSGRRRRDAVRHRARDQARRQVQRQPNDASAAQGQPQRLLPGQHQRVETRFDFAHSEQR